MRKYPMLSRKCIMSFILVFVLVLSPMVVTNADDAQQMTPAPITIVGKDVVSHQTILQVPTTDKSTKATSAMSARGVIVGGSGSGIPVADVEWSYF